jgi:phage terminase small subunit
VSNDDLLPSLSESYVVAIARNRVMGWEDLSPKARLFALEYVKNCDLAAAAKRISVSMAKAEEALANPLIQAYISNLLGDEAEESAINREFLEYHMLQTLEQVDGKSDITMLTKDGEVTGKNYNAPSKIRLLKQMQDFLEVRRMGSGPVSLASRVVPGKPRQFGTPEELWAACAEYFAWIEDNPVYDIRVEVRAGKEQHVKTPRPRIPTEGSLVIFVGCTMEDWERWSEDPVFSYVVEAARAVITEIKMSYAATSVMNPNFVARDLGLADNINNPDGNMRPPSIDFSKLSVETLRELKAAQQQEDTEG